MKASLVLFLHPPSSILTYPNLFQTPYPDNIYILFIHSYIQQGVLRMDTEKIKRTIGNKLGLYFDGLTKVVG